MNRDKPEICAYAFDLDGTLVDTEILWVEATELWLAERGCALSHEDAIAIVYGRSWLDVYADIAARFPRLGVPLAVMEEEMRVHLTRLRARGDVVIHASVALLKRLARMRPVCVVSGSSRLDVAAGLALAGVQDEVTFFLGAEDYAPGKPNPACYRLAAERLGVPADTCLAFEDSYAGVAAARAAGMRVVALARPGLPPQDFSGADLVVAELSTFDEGALCTGRDLSGRLDGAGIRRQSGLRAVLGAFRGTEKGKITARD